MTGPGPHYFKELSIESCQRSRRQLVMTFRVDGLRFHTTYWYASVDLQELEQRYGRELMDRLCFHMAAFEANKLCSLRVERLDFGPFRSLATPEFASLWRTVFRNVWAQWRYENDDPFYEGPEFDVVPGGSAPPAASVEPGVADTLAFCGGGKDSLILHRLLERAGIRHAAVVYSHSVYGPASRQHRLIDGLLTHTRASPRHRLWIQDDFLDSPVPEVHRESGVRSLTAAETPSALFAALPLALAYGYRNLVVGHEHSADSGNLRWEATGEEVNHQWGKSLQAERLLDGYVRRHLIGNLRYFSPLKPVYDVLIFQMLGGELKAVADTHSCNVNKPWCRRCPKCAYVWANYMAHLPVDAVDGMFGCNLFDLPENQLSYRQMLGLEAHTPFECIGRIEEARLAFELCRRKGMTGAAMDVYRSRVAQPDVEGILQQHLSVDPESSGMPPDVQAAVVPQMRNAAAAAQDRLWRLLR